MITLILIFYILPLICSYIIVREDLKVTPAVDLLPLLIFVPIFNIAFTIFCIHKYPNVHIKIVNAIFFIKTKKNEKEN